MSGQEDLVGIECAAFDSGQRDAIRAHLQVLLALAERQQERAIQTAKYHPFQLNDEGLFHDARVVDAVRYALSVAVGH